MYNNKYNIHTYYFDHIIPVQYCKEFVENCCNNFIAAKRKMLSTRYIFVCNAIYRNRNKSANAVLSRIFTKMGAIGVLSSFFMSLTVCRVYKNGVSLLNLLALNWIFSCAAEHYFIYTTKTVLEFWYITCCDYWLLCLCRCQPGQRRPMHYSSFL